MASGNVQLKRYFRSPAGDADRRFRPDLDLARLARPLVEALDGAAEAAVAGAGRPDDVVVGRVGNRPAALAASDRVPQAARNRADRRRPRTASRAGCCSARASTARPADCRRRCRASDCRSPRDTSAPPAAGSGASSARDSPRSSVRRRARRRSDRRRSGRSTCRGCRRRASRLPTDRCVVLPPSIVLLNSADRKYASFSLSGSMAKRV